jgi:glycosyltransferase involved in cell wall biosynthesis
VTHPSDPLAGAAALHICYDDIREPLIETQVVAYLRELARAGVAVHLLTFQKEPLAAGEGAEIRERLRAQGIRWRGLRYHSRPSLPATLFDIAQGAWTALAIARRESIRLVHARSHVAGAMASLICRWLGLPLVFDLRGLLAEEYVDNGNWRRGGLKYSLTMAMERRLLRSARGIVMLTERLRQELVTQEPGLRRPGVSIEVIPCCVDTTRFSRSDGERAATRARRSWGDRCVLVYAGKLGGWYPPREIASFFAVARQRERSLFLQVATQSDPRELQSAIASYGVLPGDYDIRRVSAADIPPLLSAADAGLSLVLPTPSKRASSPTKVGEYLAAGLPVVSTRGIGDCDTLLSTNGIGVLVRDASDKAYREAFEELKGLLRDDTTSDRCRRIAQEQLSLAQVGGPRYTRLYGRLLAGEGTPAGA